MTKFKVHYEQYHRDQFNEKDGADFKEMEIACFPPDIQDGWETTDEFWDGIVSIFIARHMPDGKIIGSAIMSDLHEYTSDVKGDYQEQSWLALKDKYPVGTAYFASLAVSPKYWNMGIATKLMWLIFTDAKRLGYKFMIDHAKVGASSHLQERFGMKQVGVEPNWYNTGGYNLYEINLEEATFG